MDYRLRVFDEAKGRLRRLRVAASSEAEVRGWASAHGYRIISIGPAPERAPVEELILDRPQATGPSRNAAVASAHAAVSATVAVPARAPSAVSGRSPGHQFDLGAGPEPSDPDSSDTQEITLDPTVLTESVGSILEEFRSPPETPSFDPGTRGAWGIELDVATRAHHSNGSTHTRPTGSNGSVAAASQASRSRTAATADAEPTRAKATPASRPGALAVAMEYLLLQRFLLPPMLRASSILMTCGGVLGIILVWVKALTSGLPSVDLGLPLPWAAVHTLGIVLTLLSTRLVLEVLAVLFEIHARLRGQG